MRQSLIPEVRLSYPNLNFIIDQWVKYNLLWKKYYEKEEKWDRIVSKVVYVKKVHSQQI